MKINAHSLLRECPDSPLRRATLTAMRARPAAVALDSVDPGEWLDFAERNRVGPIVAHALLDAAAGAASERAKTIHDASAERMRVMMEQLDLVAERLASEDIALVALKNAGIARAIHPCAACCPMGDIDTLVDRARFVEAHRLVLEAGFEHSTRAPTVEPAELEHALASGGSEYVKTVGGHEVWLELQWRAVAGRWIRSDQEPAADELLRRSVAVDGSHIRLLSPTDNLLQVALHTAKHSYVRAPGLRLHTDVDRIATWTEPDWSQLAVQAGQLTVRTAVFFSLAFARALLDSPVPDYVLAELAPGGWKQRAITNWVKRIDVFEPDEKKFNRPEMIVFHGLLYDSLGGLTASIIDNRAPGVGSAGAVARVRAATRRLRDIMTRYES